MRNAKASTADTSRAAGSRLRRSALATALALLAFCGIGAPAASAATPPTVSSEAATEIGVTTAKLSGTVNPNGEAGSGPTSWRLEYSPQGSGTWTLANQGTIEAPAAEEANPVTVEAIPGYGGELGSGQTYEFRLVAENAAGSAQTEAPYPSFTMDAFTEPALTTEAPTAITYQGATLQGTIDPEGNSNPLGPGFYFYWEFQVSGDGGANWSGAGAGELSGPEAEGTTPVAVSVEATGLAPGRTYLLRLHAFYTNWTNVFDEPNSPEAEWAEDGFATEAVSPPEAKNLQVSGVSAESAHFSGEVNSGGSGPGEGAGAYQWQCEPSCPGIEAQHEFGAEGFADGADHTVQVDAEGLLPAQPYTVKLIARNAQTDAEGEPKVAEGEFTTTAIAPDATTEPAQDVALTHASLQGYIHPHNAPTTYYFEYGATTAYGTSIPAGQNGDAGAGNLLEGVANPIYGLQPGTTYHYRLLAQNEGGTSYGADRSFTTTTPAPLGPCANAQRREEQHVSDYLPDCRAYEMVSPAEKNGGDVSPKTQRTHAASGESPGLPMAVSFISSSGFEDVHGTGIATEYLAQRTLEASTNGWSTHAITPLQQPVNLVAIVVAGNQDPHYSGDFSNDLTHAVFNAFSPLTDAPNVKDVPNLYLRNDLRTPGPGNWTLLTGAASPLSPSLAFSLFADASTDFSHVIFESFQSLTPEVPPCTPRANGNGCPPRLYETVNGMTRLAGVLPDSACGSPPCVAPSSVAGQGVNEPVSGSNFAYHTISDDGSRIFFTVAQGRSSDLYMRIDGTSTVQINAPEDGVDPTRATFWDAASDGSRAFFTSRSTGHLYMYSVEPDADGHHLMQLDVDREPQDGGGASGVIGASDDGHYVYFIETGQLIAGKPILRADRGIYLWHDDAGTPALDYVGRFNRPGDTVQNLNHTWELGAPPVARVTPDGRHLLFAATDGPGLTGYDQISACDAGADFDGKAGCTELYVYSAQADGPNHTHLHCVSCNPSGAPAIGDSTDNVQLTPDSGVAYPTNHSSHAISDDGRFVFFHTSEALVAQDTNGRIDAYEYDLSDGSVHLLSSGTDPANSYFSDASADGRDVFITTRQRLLGWDRDGARDLYDVRLGGGVPEPPALPAPCAGETCRPESATANQVPDASSPNFVGPPNPVRCRRGLVRRHGRCVRRHRRRKRASAPAHAGERVGEPR